MRGLMYRLKYAEFRHPNGLALFADRCLAACLREYAGIKIAAAARIQTLKEQAKALREQRLTLDPESAPSFEETIRNARQLRFEQILWIILLLGETALTYVAALLVVQGRGATAFILRALIAIVATFVAAVVAEKFIDEFFAIPDARSAAEMKTHRRRMWSWGAVLLGLECALWGLASIRSADIEGSLRSPILYVGMILLSVLLPPAAGGIRHDLMRRLAPVRRVERLRAIAAALEENAKQLSAARHGLESAWEIMSQEWYSTFGNFRAHKEVFNHRSQMSEPTAGMYFDTRAAFSAEARLRRDSTYGEADLLSDEVAPTEVQQFTPTLHLSVDGRDDDNFASGRAD